MAEHQPEYARVRLTSEDHYDECIRGWQEVAPLWTVRRCPHGRIQRREPGPTAMRHGDHRWVDLSRFEHPILWSRARRALSNRPAEPACPHGHRSLTECGICSGVDG